MPANNRKRRSDFGVEAAETEESDAQEGIGTREGWDSRRGSVRHGSPYRQDAGMSTQGSMDIAQGHDSMRFYISLPCHRPPIGPNAIHHFFLQRRPCFYVHYR